MNTGTLNSTALNSTSTTDHNATLGGGLDSIGTIYSLFLASAILAAPVASSAALDSSYLISAELDGGVSSTSYTEGLYNLYAELDGGIGSVAIIDGALSLDLVGGLDASSSTNGGYVISPILNYGVDSGSTWINDNQYTYPFTGGINSSTYTYGQVAVFLRGSIESSGLVGGKWGVLLKDGNYSIASVDGDITSRLVGGIGSGVANVQGMLYLPATLPGGIARSYTELGGDLIKNSGMNGGIESTSSLEFKYYTDAKPYGGITGNVVIGSNILASAVATDGIVSDCKVSASGLQDAVLKGGLDSNMEAVGFMASGMMLNYGMASTTTLGMKYFTTGNFSGGLISYLGVGGECDCNALMQSGIQAADTLGGGIIGSNIYSGGIFRAGIYLGAGIRLSPVLVEGISKNTGSNGGYKVDAVLSDGLEAFSLLDSKDVKSSVMLQGEFYSSADYSANLVVGSTGVGGVDSNSGFGSLLNVSAVLQGNVPETGWELVGNLVGNSKLQGGTNSSSLLQAEQKTDNKLFDVEGIKNSTEVGRQIKVEPAIIGGVYSFNLTMSDTDIASFYGDMLHNTSQLEIASATQVLEIEVPIGDT